MSVLKTIKKQYKRKMSKLRFLYSVNWTKTLYFNFKKFPFDVAKKLPVFFYGKVHFHTIEGQIEIKGPITRAMIGFGQRFEKAKKEKGIAEFWLEGQLVFNGPAHMGKDVLFYIGKEAYCEFGYMACLGSDVKLVCTERITLGDWAGIGYESQVIDTNSHPMINTLTGTLYPMSGAIAIGTHNAVSNRVSIMPFTRTPDFCVIASNSLCTKDYTDLGSNVLIGGVPAKLIKNNYSRDWDNEKELLKQYKIIKL